jgi:putative membrane protein
MRRRFVQRIATASSLFEEGFPSTWLQKAFRGLAAALLFFFPFGVLFLSFGWLPASLSWLASVSIAMYALLTLFSEFRAQRPGVALSVLFSISAIVFTVEWISVRTRMLFGAYRYTDALGLELLGIPVAIALAWYSLIIGAWRMGRALTRNLPFGSRRVAGPLVAATLMLLMDLVMEPVAVYLRGYWTWDGGSIPFSNYATWFLLTGVLALGMDAVFDADESVKGLRVLRGQCATSAMVFLLQLALFATTGLAAGYFIEALLALLLTAVMVAHFLMERVGDSPLEDKS